jgi:hypothetical protein
METARPMPAALIGRGSTRRGTAATMMLTAATRISPPSSPLLKYSAFSWP